MSLRIAFDLDGVLADLASAYRAVERRFFGAGAIASDTGTPETPDWSENGASADPSETTMDAASRRAAALAAEARRRRQVWQAIVDTENFWTTLAPLEDGVVARLASLAARQRWEVFFVTQRPATAGETVQRQTQRWLATQGFDLPSVLVVRGSRGPLAAALDLDYLVDDTPQHCVDVRAESSAVPVLVLREADPAQERAAARLGITVVRSVHEALDMLEGARAAAAAGSPPGVGEVRGRR